MQIDVFDVAVVGYGPTGMVLASLLGQLGHKVVVLEKWPALYGRPRLTHIDGETARLLSFCCDIKQALRDSSSIQSFKFYNANDVELLDVASIPTLPMGHPAHISIHQPDIETELDNRIRSFPNVLVRQGCEVVGISQSDELVDITFKTDAATETVRARYVFGSDGARSVTRQSLGIEREDFGFNERWLNIDGERKRPLSSSLKATRQYCDPARGHMFMPIGETRQRFEFAVLPDETTEHMENPATAWELLKHYHDVGPDDISIIRQIVYTFECRIAKSWRKGRVFLGGDAAHTMPPYLGQGACSGIRDAANMAWKLDLVLRGCASDDLLDNYERERRKHVTYIMKTARAFGKVANMHSRVGAFFRDLVFRMKILPPPAPFPAIDEGAVQRKKPGEPGNLIGTVASQSRVTIAGQEGLLDELCGYGFVLISRTNPLPKLDTRQRHFLSKLGCRFLTMGDDQTDTVRQLVDNHGNYKRYTTDIGQHAVLLRPDTSIFGFAETESDLGTLVNDLKSCLNWQEKVAEHA